MVALLLVSLMPASGRGGTRPSLTVTPSSGTVGTQLSAVATGFMPGGPIKFLWDNTILVGTVAAGSTGSATLKFGVPGAAAGQHFVRACQASITCPPDPNYADDTFTVVAPTPKPTPTPRVTRPPATPRPTPRPTASLGPSASAATSSLAPTNGPSATTPGGVPIPIPSFPIAGPSPSATPFTLIAVTPAPQPPGGVAPPVSEFANLVVKDMEITQGIQNLANDMPLVADRRTYARVYIDVFGADVWPHTWGALEARREGQQIGWIWPENGPITAKQGGGDRTSVDDSLLFRLPAGWLAGDVELTTFVYSYAIETPFTLEPESEDNFGSREVTFHDALPLTVHLAPLHLHRSYHSSDVERIYEVAQGGGFLDAGANPGGTNRIVSGPFRYLPISGVNVDAFNAGITPPGHLSGHEFDLGGACKSAFLGAGAGTIDIADWTVLVKEPLTVTADSNTLWLPDRPTVQVMDRTYTVNAFVAHANGAGTAYGSSDGAGPDPVPGAPAYAYPCVQIIDALHEPNHVLALHRVFYDWADEREMFVGMVDPTLPSSFGGIATGNTDSIWMRMFDWFSGEDPWEHAGAGVLAHEAGHRAGLGHVPCKDGDGDGVADEIAGGDLDPTHPMTLTFPDCWLSEVDDRGFYGLDVYWDRFSLSGVTVLSNDPSAPSPNRARPFLSYASPGWPDPYHYCKLLNYYGVPCSPTALDLPWNPPNPQPDGSDPFAAFTPPPNPLERGVHAGLLLLHEDEDGVVTIELAARNSMPTADQVERISAQRAIGPDPTAYSIVVRQSGAAVALPAFLSPAKKAHGSDGGSWLDGIVVPLPPDATAIEVRDAEGQLVAKLEPSPGLPDVAGLFKDTADGETIEPDDEILVSFEAGDPDGDPLRFVLLYSPDREHWQLVGTAEDERRIPVQVRNLPSGPDPAFRLVAFDGWSIDEETLPAPELGGPRNPPQIWVLTSELPPYPAGAPVRLEAAAFDVEDRDLPDEAIRWRSSIDGDLGTGGELMTRALAAGRHVITATAIDSDGLEGNATFELEIDGSVVAPIPAEALEAGMAGIFDRLGSGLDPAPTVEAHPDFAWLPLGATVVGLIGLVALLGARSLRPRRPARATLGGAPSVTVGAAQSISVGAAQEGGSPELLAHEAGHTAQGDAPPADDTSMWMPTDQLQTSGSMDPEPGVGGGTGGLESLSIMKEVDTVQPPDGTDDVAADDAPGKEN